MRVTFRQGRSPELLRRTSHCCGDWGPLADACGGREDTAEERKGTGMTTALGALCGVGRQTFETQTLSRQLLGPGPERKLPGILARTRAAATHFRGTES